MADASPGGPKSDLDKYLKAVASMAAIWLINTRSSLRRELEEGKIDGEWAKTGITGVLGDQLLAIREKLEGTPPAECKTYFEYAAAVDENVTELFWDPDDPECPPTPIIAIGVDAMLAFVTQAWDFQPGQGGGPKAA